ncbi:hypothetical protein [Nitrosospira sp. Nsp11]|uniref:hypothetical protein n=1 Tax=Nitrosospira sp. Nsp11 TaxID=1855338 RepID=UPI001160A7A5|nr:hypothetical protein [Nitrosospira sp. Nsp11]
MKTRINGRLPMLGFFKMLLLGSAIWSFCALAQTEAMPFAQEKTYLLPSGQKVAVTFRERQCKSGECHEVDAGTWGVDGGIPKFVTETFLVFIDSKQFVIPEKFYKDITNTRSLDVSELNGQVILELKGGDAAGAYSARFKLGGMCGFERKICGEVCEEIWERTTWYNSFAYELDPGCESGIQ